MRDSYELENVEVHQLHLPENSLVINDYLLIFYSLDFLKKFSNFTRGQQVSSHTFTKRTNEHYHHFKVKIYKFQARIFMLASYCGGNLLSITVSFILSFPRLIISRN